jgi:4a-hydroxytetrahydrobiopterin dehydratase
LQLAQNLHSSSIEPMNQSNLLQAGWKLVKADPSSISNSSWLERSYVFTNFISAFGFMTQVALESEKQDHHPDWTHVYNRLNIKWSTHTKNAVTDKDWHMADVCESLYQIQYAKKE